MHEDLRVELDFKAYNKAFSSWLKQNKGKYSIEFDKIIGIGSWKKIDNKTTVLIKDKKQFLLAKLKYNL
jgi:hypothetical protein